MILIPLQDLPDVRQLDGVIAVLRWPAGSAGHWGDGGWFQLRKGVVGGAGVCGGHGRSRSIKIIERGSTYRAARLGFL